MIQFLAVRDIFQQADFEKRMNRIKATWRNGCLHFFQLSCLLYTIPNHQPTKTDVLPKSSHQNILAAKWLGEHSSTACPPTSSDDLCLLFCLSPSSICRHTNRFCSKGEYNVTIPFLKNLNSKLMK